MISVEQLSVEFSAKPLFDNISFQVNPKDKIALVGKNGAGKSTMLKIFAGLQQPTSGRLSVPKGVVIGYLPQQTQLQRDFPASVYEVVLSGRLNSMGGRMFYNAEDKKAAQENMERLGIEDIKNRCYMELSGGQQQRVLLARAMCATKKLLLLDEPVTGLDPVATNEMYTLIKLINLCDSTSVIMISHDIHEAVRYATHILHLGNRQLFFGTTAQYRESDLARRFVGGGRA